MRGLFGNDWNWIVAGVVSAALLLGLEPAHPFPVPGRRRSSPRWSLPAWCSCWRRASCSKASTSIRSAAAGSRSRASCWRRPQPAADRLARRRRTIADKDMAAKVKHLSDIAADVIAKVEAKPDSAPAVRRFLTYYVPQAAEVAEGYAVLEDRRAPEPGTAGQCRRGDHQARRTPSCIMPTAWPTPNSARSTSTCNSSRSR